MKIRLPPLPYNYDDLEPYLSEQAVLTHHLMHHKAYVDKLNTLIRDTSFEELSLEEIIIQSHAQIHETKMDNNENNFEKNIFNNASQIWNHTFFWNCMTEEKDQKVSSKLHSILNRNFGSINEFKSQFSREAINLFGSGWVWLVRNKDQELEIVSCSNAESPLTQGMKPLLVCDVWEHAYYIDYESDRKKFVTNFWELVNWERLESLLTIEKGRVMKDRYTFTTMELEL